MWFFSNTLLFQISFDFEFLKENKKLQIFSLRKIAFIENLLESKSNILVKPN